MTHNNMIARDLAPQDFDALRQNVIQLGPFLRTRLCLHEVTAMDIAGAGNRWENIHTFQQDGKLFSVWVNWDGRARIECEGEVILRLWYPAGEIFKAMDDRGKANGCTSFVTLCAGRYDP